MVQLKQNGNLVNSFVVLKCCGDNRSYQTRLATIKFSDISLFKTENYGTYSVKYNCKTDLNNFKKTFRHFAQEKYTFLLAKTFVK